jgi:hypothetical protein
MSQELPRDTEIDIIKICFERLSDNQSKDIYKLFIKDVACDKKIKDDRKNMLNHIVTNLFYAKDSTIKLLYSYMHKNDLIRKNDIAKVTTEEDSDEESDAEYIDEDQAEDQDDTVIDVVLTVINSVLEANGKLKIRRLEQFQNILRDDLLTAESIEAITNNEELIFTKFKKSELGYSQRKKSNAYAFTTIKGMIRHIKGYEFRTKTHRNKVNCDKRNYTTYSINKIL